MIEESRRMKGQSDLMNGEIFSGVRWVWFDLDDTLYDFHGNSIVSLGEVYEIAALSRWWRDVDAWRDHYHVINAELWRLYAPGLIDRATLRRDRFVRPLVEAGCSENEAEMLWPELDRLYLGLLGQKKVCVAGAVEAVKRMRQLGYRIGVLSNGFKEVQYAKLASIGLSHLVDCVALSDEIDINKPDSRFFDYAVRKAETTAEECLLVGDNPDTDIAGALGAGWRAIWLAKPTSCSTDALDRACKQNSSRMLRIASLDELV